jgi:hypothetical protein
MRDKKGRFLKGHKLFPEVQYKKGVHATPRTEFKKGHVSLTKGKKHTEESKRKMRAALKGRKKPPFSEEHKRKMSEGNTGKNNSNWKGGRTKHPNGYVYIWIPGHPFSTKKGYVLEHRLVAEKELGRYLKPTEEGHHRNGKRDDNRWDNLFVFESKPEHQKYERFLRARAGIS